MPVQLAADPLSPAGYSLKHPDINAKSLHGHRTLHRFTESENKCLWPDHFAQM